MESNLHEQNSNKDEKVLSNLDDTAEARQCSYKENQKVNADTTSQTISKSHEHNVKHYVSDSQIRNHKIKPDHEMKKTKRYLLDKTDRFNSGFTSKKLKTSSSKEVLSNNSSEIITGTKSIKTMHIPVQIDREKIESTLELRLCEKEIKNSKTSYCKSQTMEADSTVLSDKKENEERNVELELCESVPTCQCQDNFDISTISNQKPSNIKKRKKEKIKKKFRLCFNECPTLSEEEEEICILDSLIHKKRKKDSNDLWNESTNIESHDISYNKTEDQDTTSYLGICKELTNETVSTKTCKTDKNLGKSETMLDIESITECNNNEIICNNNVLALQNELCSDEDVYLEKIVKFPQLENDKQIQDNSSQNHLMSSENNAKENNVEQISQLKNSTDVKGDTLSDSNININSNNDTSIEASTNCAIQLKTLSENNNNNDNFNEGSVRADNTTEIINLSSDLTFSIEKIIEKSKNTDDCSTNLHNEETFCAQTFETTQESPKISPNNIIDNISQSCQRHENIDEDLSKLLQMDIIQNYNIQSKGNAISIAECFEKEKSKENNSIINYSVSKAKETCTEQYSTKSTALKENINLVNNQNKDNIIENMNLMESKLCTSHECNTKDIDNFKKPESIKPNKIRVLSSAELGSRWCPTPVSDPVLKPIIEPEPLSHTIVVPTNNSELCKNIITESKSAMNNSHRETELKINCNTRLLEMYLLCILRNIMRIRLITNYYLSNDTKDMTTENEKSISNNERLKSYLSILLEDFISLKNELKIANMSEVIQYAITRINKYVVQKQYQAVSMKEIISYIELYNSIKSEMTEFAVCINTSVTNEQGKTQESVSNAPVKHISTVSNNGNVMKVTSPVNSHLYVPVIPQVPITNNLLQQNIHTSNISNQNTNYNISNLAIQKFNTQILHTPPVQQTNRIVQVPQENRTSSTYMPHYQHIIQQQPAPTAKTNNLNISNINMIQLNNIYSTQQVNLQQNSQDNTAKNKAGCPSYGTFLSKDQCSIPQKSPQQNMPYNISQRPQNYILQNLLVQNIPQTQVSYSTTLPTQSIFPTHSQNLPPGTNTIPHELILKIWDQVTFCLETNIFDCRLHERSDKARCFLKIFYDKWKRAVYNIIYKRSMSQHSEPIMVRSLKVKHMYSAILARNAQRLQQPPMTYESMIKQTELMKILSKPIKNNNFVSPANIESQNVVIQPEIPRYKSQSNNNVELETQHQSSTESDLQVVEKVDTASTVLKKNDTLLVESNHTKLNNTSFISYKTDNVNNLIDETALTSSKSKTENQENVPKFDRVSHLENDDIEILEVIHVNEKSSLSKQAIEEMHKNNTNSLPKDIITEVACTKKESSIEEQIIEEEMLHVEEDSSLIKKPIRDNTDHLKYDMIPDVILCEPHIIDVRSISLTCFNTEKNSCVQNYMLSPTEEDIKIKIEIPENKHCLQCSKSSTFVCEVCLDAYYCSVECANSYWMLEHYKHCKPHKFCE